MKTILGYKFDYNVGQDTIDKALERVKEYYYSPREINFELSENALNYGNIGFCIWDDAGSPLKWPNLVQSNTHAVFSHSPPHNWEQLVNDSNIHTAPLDLVRGFESGEINVHDASSPLLIGTINKITSELKIYIDSSGFGRLYEYRGENGWFWSNKIAALSIFANEYASMDFEAWKVFGSAGWFMGDQTAFKKVRRIKPSSIISVNSGYNNPRTIINYGGLDLLVSPRKYKTIDYNRVAVDIQKNLESFSSLWSLPITIDLTGGKDSRISAAAILSSKKELNFRFRTQGTLDGEVKIAKELLRKVTKEDYHDIELPHQNNKSELDLIERTRKLLHIYDGEYPPIMIKNEELPDFGYESIQSIQVQGFGGEIAKAKYYSNARWIDKLNKLGDKAPYERLSSFLNVLGCVPEESKHIVNQHIFTILEEGINKGISGLNLLEYFHLKERLRRWVPAGAHINKTSPFLTSSFQRAAFDLSPEQKLNSVLHRNIISQLIPEWEDVPFYSATPEESRERTRKKTRMWQTSDKNYVEDILYDSGSWNDIFNELEIKELWTKAKKEDIENRKETLFQRVVIRACFNDHIDGINNYIKNCKQ